MMAIGGVAIPVWVMIQRWAGTRRVWMISAGLAVACLTVLEFGFLANRSVTQVFLVVIQVSIIGLHFSFCAMVPDRVEYGQRTTGWRGEPILYGFVPLVQRLPVGLGTVIVGIQLHYVGVVPQDSTASGKSSLRFRWPSSHSPRQSRSSSRLGAGTIERSSPN